MSDVKVTPDLDHSTLVIEYLANAPKEKVWKAYTNQEWFEKWWGPEGWETAATTFDFQPGGIVHYGMKCVDESQGEWFNQVSWGVMDIEEIDAPNSFTYQDYFSDEKGVLNFELPTLTVVNEFVEEDGKTRIVSTSYAESPEQIEQLLEMGMAEGVKSQMKKLEALLA